jgi:5-formyltetrahydrofolate cyclo-ligase
MASEKNIIRQQLLAQRQNLSKSLYQQSSQQLCQHLADFLAEHFDQTGAGTTSDRLVLGYQSHRQEPDLSPLLQLSKYQWGLPRCSPEYQLAWHQWQWGEPLVPNRYGLLEPAATNLIMEVSTSTVLLIPAVAIDQQGYRLGYGGGYFDRLLSQQPWQQVLTIGVVFDFAYLPTLPRMAWDQPLAAICTELGLMRF